MATVVLSNNKPKVSRKKVSGATKFSKSSTTTSSYSVKMSAAVSGRQVYCVVKDSYGNSVKTNTVTLKMK